MKKSLLMFLAVFAAYLLPAQTVQRTVLIESFTNASCPPCAAQNPGFNVLLGNNVGKVAVIKYQTDWPGYDPMNEQNPEQVQTRVDYYGVTGVPNVRIDGTTNAGTSGSVTQTMINTAYAVPAPLQITLTHSLSADLSQMTINCDITNPNTTTEWNVPNAYLRIGMIEKDLNFPVAPGSTAETHFTYVMRKMYPDATGTLVAPIAAGATANYTWTVDIPDYIYDYSQLAVVGFVQAEAPKTVYQSAISQPITLTGLPNTAFAGNTTGNTGICDQNLVPAVSVTNDGDVDITSFTVGYALNDGASVTESWTGTLTPGNQVDITFPAINIVGQVGLSYSISEINGTYPDVYAFNDNIAIQQFGAFGTVPFGETLTEGMEAAANYGVPANSVAERAANEHMMVAEKNLFGAPAAIGGFAASEKALFVEIYNMLPGVASAITFGKLDFTNRDTNIMTFDLAYRQYQAENDRLQVSISTDCGATWTNVYDKAGSALATLGAATGYFVPQSANQWRTETVDLSAWDGATDIMVRFDVTSAYGNNLYLDNINIAGVFVSGVEDAILDGNVNVYPNPATSEVNVDFTLTKANKVSVNVYDVTGKLVATLLNSEVLGAGVQNVQWNNPASTGLYFLNITTEEGTITRKVSVVK